MTAACWKRFYITGRVQGVFFRASTVARARELGLAGWARNLTDGRVEVLAGGDENRVAELEAWLSEGPPMARVTRVEAVAVPGEELPPGDGFTVA